MALRAARTEKFSNKRLKQLRMRVILLCLTVLARLSMAGQLFRGEEAKLNGCEKYTHFLFMRLDAILLQCAYLRGFSCPAPIDSRKRKPIYLHEELQMRV